MSSGAPNLVGSRDHQSNHSQSGKQSNKVGPSSDNGEHLERKLSKNELGNRKGWQKLQFYLEKLLDHNVFQITMGIVTIYALFGDDIRVLSTDKYGDPVFWSLNIFCLVSFSVEIILTCLVKKGYFHSFFFYLDVISTISLILDIGWISNSIFSQGSSKASNAASLAKAGRASRVGTKAGRIVRIVRLIRLVKLYKLAQQRLQQEAEKLQQMETEQNQHDNDDHNELGNHTAMQKKVNNMIKQERFTKNLRQMRRQLTSQSNKQVEERDQDIENNLKLLNPTPEVHHNQPIEEVKPHDEQKADDIKQNNKLPPLASPVMHAIEGSPNIPSKPIVLDKYKDDPLLQATNLNSEQNDMLDKKDPKKMAKDIMQMNQQNSLTKKYSKSSTSQRLQEEKAKRNNTDSDYAESKVGQKLSDVTTQKVIIIVLCIMISIPIFDSSTYIESPAAYDNGIRFIWANFNKGRNELGKKSMENYLTYLNDQRNPILYMENKSIKDDCCNVYPSAVFNDSRDSQDSLRNEDKYYYTYSVDGELVGFAILDIRGDNELNAILSIVRTIFVSVVLSSGAILFSSDVETLVLTPIENMMKKVKRIAENPLEAAQIEEREALALEQLAKDGNVKELQKLKEQEGYETVVLEKLIIKIGALLALGFGEAGSEIIASNMSKGGEVDPMIPGKKIMAIFGFCDIRNFTDATEVLQTGVMLFVNEIAEITHSTVDSFLGQSNKNIGDAFLLVWKYNEDDYFMNKEKQLELKDSQRIHYLADLPVIAFLKIMSAITISKKLYKYRSHKGLNERLKNYRVKMGFGLHVGWAIEGAIGSGFKIDASYLSPNVNMASRLEAATKQFGTGLLISGPLYNILTENCKKHLRHIDRVTVKGSILPLDLYTVDVHLDNIVAKKAGKDKFDNAHLSLAIKKKNRVIERLKRNKFRDGIISGRECPNQLFQTDKELVAMREFFIPEFYEQWNVGFKHYLDGKWPQAKAIFEKTLVMLKHNGIIDGPSNTLIEVIDENGGKAPSDWDGFRALTEK